MRDFLCMCPENFFIFPGFKAHCWKWSSW